jgi:methylmalonyl-CoA mutase N-terminal domain/subunit
MWFRTACQTSALPLTAQEPLNNIVRAGIQTLAAVLAGVQSIHTTGYDEAFSLPTEESHKLSIMCYQLGDDMNSGRQPIVGVNLFRDESDSTKIHIFRHNDEWQQRRIQEIIEHKKNRPQEPVKRALDALERQTRQRPQENCIEPIMKAVEARATLGEIMDAVRKAIDFKRPGM